MPNRPKTYDRPGYREQSRKFRELERLAEQEMEDPYAIFGQLTEGERASLDATKGYGHGWQDGRDGRPITGSSPEYEDGYLAGLKVGVEQRQLREQLGYERDVQ